MQKTVRLYPVDSSSGFPEYQRTLSYEYDGDGNVVRIWSSTPGGLDDAYEYDALNRRHCRQAP